MAKAKWALYPFLYLIIPIVLFVIFGDVLFDIGLFIRTKEIQQMIPVYTNIFESNTTNNIEQINNTQHIKNYNKPIFFDSERFTNLTQYHASLNSMHPSSWIDLNNQLFCPIKYSMSLNPINTISSSAERLLKAIYNLQFLNDCHDLNHKFLILDLSVFGDSGLGAVTNGFLIKFLFRALVTNRTLLLHGKWKWSSKPCDLKYNAMECYFLPISNCDANQLIQRSQKNDKFSYHIGLMPDAKICDLGAYYENINSFSDKPCQQQVIHITINHRGMPYHPLMKTINDEMMKKYFCNYQCYRAVATSFFYRLQFKTLQIVYQKVRHSIIASMVNNDEKIFNPMNTISLPIRGTDKCSNDERYVGEMECWSIMEYIGFLRSVKYLSFGRIDTVIITSESIEIIDEIKNKINKSEWNIILNIDDSVPSSGNAKYINLEDDDLEDDDLENDVIIGGLSSLLLQMNSKYIAFTRSSNWLDNMWNIAEELNCEEIFWKKELLYKDVNDDNYYFNFNKQCFEFRQFGVLNRKIHNKHILYPPDLWDIIHAKNLNPHKFSLMFGVNITDAGWNTYCDRYMEDPFIDALHID